MFLLSFYVRVFNEALLVVSRQLLSTSVAILYTAILKSFFTCCILQSLAAALDLFIQFEFWSIKDIEVKIFHDEDETSDGKSARSVIIPASENLPKR